MRDLNAEFGAAGAPRARDHPRQRRLVVVGIKPQAAMGDAAVALNVGGLHDYQRGAGICQHAEVHQMPVIGAAIVGRVLAHRRDDDTVGKVETGQPVGRKQGAAHGIPNSRGENGLIVGACSYPKTGTHFSGSCA
jgi:hypothetical protein